MKNHNFYNLSQSGARSARMALGLIFLSVLLPVFPTSHLSAADCFIVAPGCLDSTFGGSLVPGNPAGAGRVMTNTDGAGDIDQARAVAIQTDSKIVAVGTTTNPVSSITNFALVRYNTDGNLDSTFGNGGIVKTIIATGNDDARAVAIQSDGKILAVGTAANSTTLLLAVARYNGADGSLDLTFGSGGITTVDFGTGGGCGPTGSVAIQTDGKIVIAGACGFNVARLNSNGSLDAAFGTGGKVSISFSRHGDKAAWGVTIQSDGKIVVAGYAILDPPVGNKNGYDFALARLNPANGSLDTTFGGTGMVTTDFSLSDDRGRALAIDASGKIVVGGRWCCTAQGTPMFAVARYNTDGSLDSTFGSGGKVTTSIFNSLTDALGIAIQSSDGKIVQAGYSYTFSPFVGYFALVRWNTNGALDTTFGAAGTGIVTTQIATGESFAYGLALQPDAKIVAGGSADIATPVDPFYFALARYFQ